MHQAGHMRDLIWGVGINMDPEGIDAVPLSDPFSLNTHLSIPPPHCLGSELIYACPQRIMGPIGLPKALHDSSRSRPPLPTLCRSLR